MTLHCQICGEHFATAAYDRRFCGNACRNRFNGLRTYRPAEPVKTQRAILAILRERPGQWVDGRFVAVRIYGRDGAAELHALRGALYRLRAAWGSTGLVVGTRVERRRYDRVRAISYRLEADIGTPAAVAS